jgi:hypothetical protein
MHNVDSNRPAGHIQTRGTPHSPFAHVDQRRRIWFSEECGGLIEARKAEQFKAELLQQNVLCCRDRVQCRQAEIVGHRPKPDSSWIQEIAFHAANLN